MIITSIFSFLTKKIYNTLIIILELLRHISRAAYLVINTFSTIKYIPNVEKIIIKEMWIIGIGSIPLVIAAAVFLGGETVLQTEFQFRGIVPVRYLGMAVCKALITELCPVLISFVVSSRIATSIAAELGTMKTAEQIDAMKCLNLDPFRYLVMPKLSACVVMLPVLVVIGELAAFIASITIAVFFIDITPFTYIQGFRLFFNPFELLTGIFKSAIFGLIICFTGAYCGLQTKDGASGVGASTTNAVVISAIMILISDFSIGYLLK
jgi:phospholipid/cholesterol/gamma-HCH transport system permease protein